MLTKIISQMKVIQSDNLVDFSNRYNEVMGSIAIQELGENVKEKWINQDGTYTMLITYEIQKEIAENEKDICEMRGEEHKCPECPFWQPPMDGRKHHGVCGLNDCRTSQYHKACNEYYKEMERRAKLLTGD